MTTFRSKKFHKINDKKSTKKEERNKKATFQNFRSLLSLLPTTIYVIYNYFL